MLNFLKASKKEPRYYKEGVLFFLTWILPLCILIVIGGIVSIPILLKEKFGKLRDVWLSPNSLQ